MCGNLLLNLRITKLQSELGEEPDGEADCVTCGAERDERQRVLADHRQLIFGQRQPVYDVLYEVVGDDRRHVPPKFPQYNQFPVLQKTMTKGKKRINT